MLLLLYIKVHVRSPNVQYVHILSPLSSPNVFILYLSLSSLSIYISIFLSKLSPPPAPHMPHNKCLLVVPSYPTQHCTTPYSSTFNLCG